MTWRILLQYPGGEVTLHEYKKPMPIHDVSRKAVGFAQDLFESWQWANDPDLPAIESNKGSLILCVVGPRGADCYL
jgi:hypothetical protein